MKTTTSRNEMSVTHLEELTTILTALTGMPEKSEEYIRGERAVIVRELFPPGCPGGEQALPEDLLPALIVMIRKGAIPEEDRFVLKTDLRLEPPFIFNGLTQWRTLAESDWFNRHYSWTRKERPKPDYLRTVYSTLGKEPAAAAAAILEFLGIFGYPNCGPLLIKDNAIHPGIYWTADLSPELQVFPQLAEEIARFIEEAKKRENETTEDDEANIWLTMRIANGSDEEFHLSYYPESDMLYFLEHFYLPEDIHILDYPNLGCFDRQYWTTSLMLKGPLAADDLEFTSALLSDLFLYRHPGLTPENLMIYMEIV